MHTATLAGAIKQLAGAVAADNDADGLQENDNIEEQTAMLHVVEIVGELSFGVFQRRSVAKADLGPGLLSLRSVAGRHQTKALLRSLLREASQSALRYCHSPEDRRRRCPRRRRPLTV